MLTVTADDLRLVDAYLQNEEATAPAGVSVGWGCVTADPGLAEMTFCVGKAAACLGAAEALSAGATTLSAGGLVVLTGTAVARVIEHETDSGYYAVSGTAARSVQLDVLNGPWVSRAVMGLVGAFVRAPGPTGDAAGGPLCAGQCPQDPCAGVACDAVAGATCTAGAIRSTAGARCDPPTGTCVTDTASTTACPGGCTGPYCNP